MNKLFKKLFVLLLALTVAFAAVGCDACNDGEDPDAGNTPTTPDTTVLQPEAPEITMMSQKELVIGDDFYLAPKTKNVKGDLLWNSSDPTVATVSNGVVSALKEGKTTVTASYEGVSASAEITVGYGSYTPNIATYSGIDAVDTVKTVLAVGNGYQLGAYVDFNNKTFSDATFTYASSNEEFLTVDANGVVTPIESCDDVKVTVTATWRKFTVAKTFSIDVRENVLFYSNNDDALKNLIINTPAVYTPVEERNNVINIAPSVKVGPEATVDNNVSVEVVDMKDPIEAEYSYDAENKVYTALALGKVMINLSYVYEGKTYASNFTIEAVRPVKEIALPVELYSAGAGTYKVLDTGTGKYVNKTLVDYAWGEDADITLYDAYQDGEELKVNGEIAENILVNFDSYTDTAVTLGTKTEQYVVYLDDACSYYISDADDVIGAFDKTNKEFSSIGYYVFLNDVDMTGAPAIKNTTEVKFQGVVEGQGHSIIKPVVDLSKPANKGFFGMIQSGSTVRNLAFIDINSIGHQPNVGWLTGEYSTNQETITFENIYIDVNEEMQHRGGMFARIYGKLNNFIVYQNNGAEFDGKDWIINADGNYGNSLLARITSTIVDTNNLNNVYVISGRVLQYTYTSDVKLSEPVYNDDNSIAVDDKGAKKWGSQMTYGENETELDYVYKYFTNSTAIGGLGLKNPTVQSVIQAMGGNGKIAVAPNVRVYDSYNDMTVDTDEKHLTNLVEFTYSPYWVIVNGAPVWKGIYDNVELHDEYFGINVGNQSAKNKVAVKNYTDYTLTLNTFKSELVTDLTFTAEANDYFDVKEIKGEDNAVIGYKIVTKKVSDGQSVDLVASFKYNGVAKTKTIYVEVVNLFDVAINEVITEDGADVAIDGDYQFAISINGTAIENVTYASNDATVLALKDETTDTFTALKGGIATITATFKYDEKDETRDFVVNVVDTIKLSSYVQIGVETVDEEISLDVYKEYIVDVVCNDTVYEANKLALTSSNTEIVSVEGNVIKILKYFEGASSTISVTLTEKGRTYNYSFVVNVYDSVVEKSVITVGGVELEGSSINIEIPGSAVIGVNYNSAAVEEVTLSGYDANAVTVEGTTITANSSTSFDLIVTYVVGGKNHVIVIPVACIYPSITIDTPVDYDASTGKLITTATLEGDIFGASAGGQQLTIGDGLTVDNNGITLRAQTSETDSVAGIPYITNKKGSNQVFELTIQTNVNTYVFTNVTYWTKIIYNATDLKEALGWDVKYEVRTYTADEATDRETELNGNGYFVATTKSGSNYYEGVYNAGIYKMMADVNMYHVDTNNPENSGPKGIGYTNNPLDSNSKIGGFVGYFDGNGYTIDNFKPDAQGLFGRVSTYVAGNVVAGTNVTAGRRYVDCKPVIKNLALTDVITTYYDGTIFYATPILANLLGTNTDYKLPHTTTVENIYVTVSSDSTALGSLVTHLGGCTKMNNVYIKNQNEFNMVEVDGKFYRMTDDFTRPTVKNGTKVWNVMKNWKDSRDGVLFGWAYSTLGEAPSSDDTATGTLDNTTNVHVVSTMPINFSSKSSMFEFAYSASYTGIKFSADNGIEFNNDSIYKLGKINKDKTNVYVAVAYAANEEVGNILIPYGFKQSAIDDVKYILRPVTEDTLTTGLGLEFKGNYNDSAFICENCGEITFSVTGRTVKAKDDCLSGCGGKYVDTANYKVKNSANKTGNGPFASPCVYKFTVHTAADMGEYYSDSNGAFKLKGVYKYSDVDAMKAANNDYCSFTGEAGNGLWNVVEGELKWVGRVA